jgi:peptidoglycan/LPS O-acetylase OafA/YrhL
MNFARAYSWGSPEDLDVLGHTWSLSIEEQFYLLWPALLLLLLRLPRRWAFGLWAAILGGPLLVRLVTYAPDNTFQLYNLPWDRFDQLTVGAALAVAVTSATRAEKIRAVARWAGWGGAAIIAVVAVGLSVETVEGTVGAVYYTVGFAVVGLASAAVIANLALIPEGWPARLLAWGPISRFGLRYSYGAYLWHHAVFRAVDHFDGFSRPLSVALKVFITVACVLASYWLVERPALRRKNRHEVPRADWTGRLAVEAIQR